MEIFTVLFCLITVGTLFGSLFCVPVFFMVLFNARARATLFRSVDGRSMPSDDRLAFWLGAATVITVITVITGIGAIIENL